MFIHLDFRISHRPVDSSLDYIVQDFTTDNTFSVLEFHKEHQGVYSCQVKNGEFNYDVIVSAGTIKLELMRESCSLSVCLSICLSVCLSVCLNIYS